MIRFFLWNYQPSFYDLKQSIENLHAKNDLGSLLLQKL